LEVRQTNGAVASGLPEAGSGLSFLESIMTFRNSAVLVGGWVAVVVASGSAAAVVAQTLI